VRTFLPSTPGWQIFRRVTLIAMAASAMLGTVFLLAWLKPEAHDAHDFREVAEVEPLRTGDPIAHESEVFSDLRNNLAMISTTEQAPHISVADIALRRTRRAFPGAPPFIPHELAPGLQRTQDCAPCHRLGGYQPGFVTYAPRTPHPRFRTCMQCHVNVVTDDLFRPTEWRTVAWPVVDGRLDEGTPPLIPHLLQMRTNCLTCHGGPAAEVEIKSGHPERFNCRQCHLYAPEPVEPFSRPLDGGIGR